MEKSKKTPRGVKGNNGGMRHGEKKKKNVLFITAAVTVAIALVVGIVLGVIAIVNSVRSVMTYKGQMMDEKVATYLISVYKPYYLKDLGNAGITYAEDTPEFWARQNPDGSGTFGEGFIRASENYLKEILVGAYLYDKNAEFTKKQEEAVIKSANQAAEFYYGTEGFDALFEADAKKMGYDYKSYLKAAELLYKSRKARSVIYGNDGSGASYFPNECNEYLNLAYSHVQLLFIRTETTFRTDEAGNRVKEAGSYILDSLSAVDAENRKNDINRLKEMIDNYNNNTGTDDSAKITLDTIEAYAKKDAYKSDQSVERIESGYYFSENSDYTKSFLTAEGSLEPVVKKALEIKIDERGNGFGYCKVNLMSNKDSDTETNTEEVWCFIYKDASTRNAYADSGLNKFFTDFYSDVAQFYLHPSDVAERSVDVKVKKKFFEMPICEIPKNNMHVIREFLEV